MPYVIAQPCIGRKDASCVAVCPVHCISEGDDQYFINPDECSECGACVAACPVDAIFDESSVPDQWRQYIKLNHDFFGL